MWRIERPNIKHLSNKYNTTEIKPVPFCNDPHILSPALQCLWLSLHFSTVDIVKLVHQVNRIQKIDTVD